MATKAIEHQRREQAFRDYCNLELQGIKPSPHALYTHYIKLNRESPELRPMIPTTNRTTIYSWAKDDNWQERYLAKREQEDAVRDQKFDKIRESTYGRLVSFQIDALDTIVELARTATDQKVRLQAAETILDRTGLGKVPAKLQTAAVDSKPEMEEADPLPQDATEEQIMQWIVTNSGNSLNA